MSFQDRLRGESGRKNEPLDDTLQRTIEMENHFPFASVDFLRLGSAHAEEKNNNRQDLVKVTERLAHQIEAQYEPLRPRSQVVIVPKY
jgi:hypothetical protein